MQQSATFYNSARREDLGTGDYTAKNWVPEQFWEPSKKFEQSMMGDAEQQLEGKNKILEGC